MEVYVPENGYNYYIVLGVINNINATIYRVVHIPEETSISRIPVNDIKQSIRNKSSYNISSYYPLIDDINDFQDTIYQ